MLGGAAVSAPHGSLPVSHFRLPFRSPLARLKLASQFPSYILNAFVETVWVSFHFPLAYKEEEIPVGFLTDRGTGTLSWLRGVTLKPVPLPAPRASGLRDRMGRDVRPVMATNSMSDPRRPNKVLRYKPPPSECNPALDDPTPDYMNLLGMIFSMCGLMLKLKWCAWVAVYCSFISFANSRSSEDTKQMMSSFMLSISAVVMSYLQNPQPMTPPW